MASYRRFSFNGEWYQSEANVMHKFLVNYYPEEKCIEIFDRRTNKIFLKRNRLNNANDAHFYVGAKVNVFGRQIRLIDYADETTRHMLANSRERTFCIIKTHAIRQFADILKLIKEHDFIINNCAMIEIDSDFCNELMENGDPGETISAGVVIALELIACDAVKRLQKLLVPLNGSKDNNNEHSAKIHGIDLFQKSTYVSASRESVNNGLELVFGAPKACALPKPVACFDSTTLAIIKPHAIQAGHLVDIVSNIVENGFIITAMKMFEMDDEHCKEFYEVYKDVVSEYLQMAIELSSGKFLALEIGADNANMNVYNEFRKLCGPSDPIVARQIHPTSIRAKFGVNKVQNAIHCTDLEEDCRLEVEYFFKILSS